MAPQIAVLTLHGMGEQKAGYADALRSGLAARLGGKMADVSWHEILYATAFDENERRVWKAMSKHTEADFLHRFVLFAFADAVGLEDGQERPDSIYAQTQVTIARALLAAYEAMQGPGPVVVAASSLGCQIFSCFMYDAQCWLAHRADPTKRPPPFGLFAHFDRYKDAIFGPGAAPTEEALRAVAGRFVTGFHTSGCNIAVFVAAHDEKDIIAIEKPNPRFEWVNLYDKDDVLGWPLQPLSESYKALVRDEKVSVGNFFSRWIAGQTPASHLMYWTTDVVVDELEALVRRELPALAGTGT